MDYLYKLIQIDNLSATPKYMQIVNSVVKAINTGKIQDDDMLPSINDMSNEFEVSRDTVEKGYRHLKKIGVLDSIAGKGYFIKTTAAVQISKVFLLFNKLSTHKKKIYDAFASELGAEAAIDFYIYNNDFGLFKQLIKKSIDQYSHYVIIPHLMEGAEQVNSVIDLIPKAKLILLDKTVSGLTEGYSSVYENFEQDLYDALEKAIPQLQKYHTLKLIFPEYTYHPREIVKGFQRFCNEYAFESGVIEDISEEKIENGHVYISLMEDDLVTLVERLVDAGKQAGKDVGVISYNETPLKKIILNGVTTISTDFEQMGKKAAEIILSKEQQHAAVPFHLTLRSSL